MSEYTQLIQWGTNAGPQIVRHSLNTSLEDSYSFQFEVPSAVGAL
jgi:hypothetical protein